MSIDINDYAVCTQALLNKDDIGIDVRDDPTVIAHFRAAKDARAEARGIERLFWRNEGADNSKGSWEIVSKEVQSLLNAHTADLELYAWLCESWLRLYGYHGLGQAFTLLQQALEKFSDTLYPILAEDEDKEWKVIALTGLNGEDADGSLIAPLSNVPLSINGQFCLWHYRRATALANMTDEEEIQRQMAQGVVSLDELTQAIQETGKEALALQLRSMEEALEKFEALEFTLTEVFGQDAPPTSRIRTTLSECIEQCRYLMVAVFGDDICLNEAIELAASEAVDNADTRSGPIANRQQALQTLLSVGHYFKQHEPQSPIPYMLERVVSWADLAWPDLIARVVQNQAEMEHIFNLTGIHMQEEVVSEM